ncbi:MAG: uL30 family ribosomal protein [Candidatus Nanohalobium sp.]
MIAAVQIRGTVDARKKAKHSLQHLGLNKRNQLVLLEDNDAIRGQLSVAKDYITFGEISDETVEKLEEASGRNLDTGDTVKLSPPTRGYKNTRQQVGQGGSLGERDEMNDLIKRMV